MKTCQCYCGCQRELWSLLQSKNLDRLCWKCYFEFWERFRKNYGKGSHKGVKRKLACCGGRLGHTRECVG